MSVERRGQVIRAAIMLVNWQQEEPIDRGEGRPILSSCPHSTERPLTQMVRCLLYLPTRLVSNSTVFAQQVGAAEAGLMLKVAYKRSCREIQDILTVELELSMAGHHRVTRVISADLSTTRIDPVQPYLATPTAEYAQCRINGIEFLRRVQRA
jgi:hypothetical protein